ncbi:DNA replication/repair protein RecF [Pseudoalteromonas sp. MMG010]|uniref:DNA replication/repair protein RecF n=1 Tax=Pseudoalteromonas sp. MMG010 TaxID=2822685 RepID=UPI001B39FDA2|nr:DNA replication/repair protein RecF [Pseudoalteromonas sp. MMG010]MBQ4834572.1 DNA replication/repair protein RecF [Pseudoalteromonas sp. MMG010]
MSLSHLSLKYFRNIEALTLEPVDGVNIIYGANGSGKTSLLEAIYYLSHGKSFRTPKHKSIISHQQSQFIIHGRKTLHDLSIPIGISKSQSGDTQLKIQGKASRKVSDLAQLMPVQVITPESYSLFFGGPKERRKFLDLGLFHVEHEFFYLWQSFNKVLKQRNALLKSKPKNYFDQIKFWDKEFVRLAEQINKLRLAYIARFQSHFFDKMCAELSLIRDINIQFNAGWKDDESLADALEKNFERDSRQGFTSKGPHKADFNFSVDGNSVENIFSRGQLKLLLYALKVTQNSLIELETDKQSILLIDDLPSELGEDTKEKVGQLLSHCRSQIFISSILSESISAVVEPMKRELKMFHVKHGNLITR